MLISSSDTDPPHTLPPYPDFLFSVFVTHTNLRRLRLSASAALVTSCLFNLWEPNWHWKRSLCWRRHSVLGSVKNTLLTPHISLKGNVSVTGREIRLKLLWLQVKTANLPWTASNLTFQLEHERKKTPKQTNKRSWRRPWANEGDGGWARALMAPCDSATSRRSLSADSRAGNCHCLWEERGNQGANIFSTMKDFKMKNFNNINLRLLPTD